MQAVWVELNIGEIFEEELSEKIEIIEKPRFTERNEIIINDKGNIPYVYITDEMTVILHNMLNISIQRINNSLQLKEQ